MTDVIWAQQALVATNGTTRWANDVRIEIDNGRIESITEDSPPDAQHEGHRVGTLIAAPANLHSHSFQRAMAGMTEQRGPDPRDSFWTWRKLMYRFLDRLNPDDIQAIAAFVFMQMAEAGYAAVAEFHYLHHQPDGAPYSNIGETSERIVAAAHGTGIGLTLLPVLYQYGGCDERALGQGQVRFGNNEDQFAQLMDSARRSVATIHTDCNIGTAPHSVRAVNASGLAASVQLADGGPVHIHVSEQVLEVEEVLAHHGATPANWLMEQQDVNERWCFIHGTQMLGDEIRAFAQRGGVFGLCPVTESNLGDGIFDARALQDANGHFGIGSDSNIRIALSEELRLLEFTQRLKHKERAVHATREQSTGRALLDRATAGSARALNRNSGAIETNRLADLLALDNGALDLEHKQGDTLLDAWIFASNDSVISDVWSAGRHIVKEARHVHHDAITATYRKTIKDLIDTI